MSIAKNLPAVMLFRPHCKTDEESMAKVQEITYLPEMGAIIRRTLLIDEAEISKIEFCHDNLQLKLNLGWQLVFYDKKPLGYLKMKEEEE